jgi:RNA polymerase sigma factor (sigma-70 family)
MTSQRGTVGSRLDALPALESGGYPGTRSSGQGRQAGAAAADPGHTLAAVREQRAGVADIAQLVRRAAEGDHWAWERLVDQYARLIWAMTRDFKLVESDAADVFQATWLRLLEHIDRLEQPARVGSWLAATARHECLRSLAARKRVMLVHDDVTLEDGPAHGPEIDERLLSEERAQAVRDALSRLPWRWRRLVEMLMADPPVPYTEISDQLGLPIGSIGPTRGRCLERLRVLLQAS